LWLKDTLRVRGEHNKILVSVKKLEIKEVDTHRDNELSEIFYIQNTKKFHLTIKVAIELFTDKDPIFPVAELQMNLSYQRPISELISLNERYEIDQEIKKDIIFKLNSKLEQSFPKYFSKFIKR
jgi:predicted acetyltransferase